MTGVIDQKSELALWVPELEGQVRIDLEGVTSINQTGIQSWVHFLEQLAQRGCAVRLEKCAEAVVILLNLVSAARAPIESFKAPYACTSCARSEEACLVVAEHARTLRAGKLPTLRCQSCGGSMVLEDDPVRYVGFLLGPGAPQ
jgi:ABC-type transporter Mla MlaB component